MGGADELVARVVGIDDVVLRRRAGRKQTARAVDEVVGGHRRARREHMGEPLHEPAAVQGVGGSGDELPGTGPGKTADRRERGQIRLIGEGHALRRDKTAVLENGNQAVGQAVVRVAVVEQNRAATDRQFQVQGPAHVVRCVPDGAVERADAQ